MPDLSRLLADAIDSRRCLDHVREIGHYDRTLGSAAYHAAAAYTEDALRRMGLTTRVVTWPMDDTPVPWNWAVPRAWEAQAALFKVVAPEERTLVNLAVTPTCLHPWSAATPPQGVTAEVVYVGAGLSDGDYVGKDVRGKIVFADRGANWQLYVQAIQRRGALGYISDDILEIPGVKTRERYPDMVLWYTFYEREFDTGAPVAGWGFSISPAMGDYLRGLLRRGPVVGHAVVRARTFDGVMENVLGSIEGEDAGGEEFLCMAHLDHYRPGAMDNAAGCAVLLEAAGVLGRLIREGALPPPRRAIRFLFGPEGHMSNVYPHTLGDGIRRIVGSWTADTVGARPHVVGGPLLLARASAATPTFLDDLGVAILKESCRWYPAVGEEPRAGREGMAGPVTLGRATSAFKFDTIRYGIYSDNSCIAGWGVPAVGIMQWPSIIWHTQYDTIDKLDATELARCAWATAMVSYQVAAAGSREALLWMHDVADAARARLAALARRARYDLLGRAGDAGAALPALAAAQRHRLALDRAAITSCLRLAHDAQGDARTALEGAAQRLGEGLAQQAEADFRVLEGVAATAGVVVSGRLTSEPVPVGALGRRPRRVRPGLVNMKYQAIALGPAFAARDAHYMDRLAEMMNLSDGSRTIAEIADVLGHEIGPISPALVVEMFASLERLGFVRLDGA
jgi:hypothetical protein